MAEQKPTCEKCGAELKPDSDRCLKCGFRPPVDPRSWHAFRRGQGGDGKAITEGLIDERF
jgi:tRNA(Ile2) C34 agmatinyltransferase TiaS